MLSQFPEHWECAQYDKNRVLTGRVKTNHSTVKILRDCFGRNVRLSDERRLHILQHPEMSGFEDAIVATLKFPTEVRLSRSDETVRLYYAFYPHTAVGSKWLCVVVKYLAEDAFIVTAYLTDKLKAGETLWLKP